MGMPITVEIVDRKAIQGHIDRVFDFFRYVDETFSTFKESSEISRINAGRLRLKDAGADMQLIFRLAEETKQRTNGYFDIKQKDLIDPSGIVKGWAIERAADLLWNSGMRNFFVDAGGDIAAIGRNGDGRPWRVGIRNPFNRNEIVKVIAISGFGVATSGTYIRGSHIYDPLDDHRAVTELISLTVIGPNVYEADRFATAAFAMGKRGVVFLDRLPGFEAYAIDANGTATLTSGFERFLAAA